MANTPWTGGTSSSSESNTGNSQSTWGTVGNPIGYSNGTSNEVQSLSVSWEGELACPPKLATSYYVCNEDYYNPIQEIIIGMINGYGLLKTTYNDPNSKEAMKKTVIYGGGVIVVVVGGVAYGVAAADYGATTVASMAEEEVIKYIYANPLKVKFVYNLVEDVWLTPPTKTIPGTIYTWFVTTMGS